MTSRDHDHTAGVALDLVEPYTPRAIHYEEADVLEYVEKDVPTVFVSVYCGLDLLADMKTREIIGWRISDWSHFAPSSAKPAERD